MQEILFVTDRKCPKGDDVRCYIRIRRHFVSYIATGRSPTSIVACLCVRPSSSNFRVLLGSKCGRFTWGGSEYGTALSRLRSHSSSEGIPQTIGKIDGQAPNLIQPESQRNRSHVVGNRECLFVKHIQPIFEVIVFKIECFQLVTFDSFKQNAGS